MKKHIALTIFILQLWLIATAQTNIIIGPNSLPPFVAGQAFSFSLTATGGVPPYVWSPNLLPPGFNLNATNGTVSGTAVAGNYVLYVKATDSLGTNSQHPWSFKVGAAPAGTAGGTVNPPVQPPAQYSVTVVNGTLLGGGTAGNFAAGATVSIVAGTPPAGQWFKQWNGNAAVANSFTNATTFTMPSANVTETASFYTPPPLVPTVTSHPRLWITTNDLPRLRAWANTNNPVFQQGLSAVLATANKAYNLCFSNGLPVSPYPDLGDIYGYAGAGIYSDLESEQHELTLAFFALIDSHAANRLQYAQMARQMLMYEMNEAAKGHTNGQPFRDPFFALFNRTHTVGEMWPLIVDWLQGVTDATGQPVTILTASDKATIRKVFMMWADDCLNASTTGGDHPAPIGFINTPALLPNGNAMRVAANNYYSCHARLITMMPLALDPADDPALNPGIPDSVLGNTLRSYLLDATGAWLYQQYAIYGDPAAVRTAYGLPATSNVGLSSGGLPVEGGLYGHSYAYVLGGLLALQTAGLNDPNLSGPQIALIGAPVWDRFAKGFMSQMVNTPQVIPSISYLGPIYQMASYGDLIRLYVTPDFSQAYALLALIEQQQGKTNHLNEARWFAINATSGGQAGLLNRVAQPWTTAESILYFMLFDPAAPAPTDPRPTYATTFYDAPQARLIARSGWTANDTIFTYRAAPQSINHVNCDAGQFELWRKGEWLTKECANYDDYNNGQSTIWHNTLALKNWCSAGTPSLSALDTAFFINGSTWNNGENAGDPSSLRSRGPKYDFVQTDLTPLYNRPSLWTPANALLDIQHASRSVLHLNNDYVVVYDRAASLHAGLFKRFNLNFTVPPVLNANGNLVTETTPHGQQLFVQTLLPVNPTYHWAAAAGAVTHIADTEPTVGRVVVEDTNNPANMRFLHVLQASDPNVTATPSSLVQSFAGNAFDGAAFGSSLVMFAHDLNVPFTGTAYTAPPTATTHYVTGLMPGASYSIAEQWDASGNVQIALTPGGSLTADSAGVLVFNP